VVRILQNGIKLNRIPSVYMFSGPRGTGKTTIARLICKTLNCDDLKRRLASMEPPEPCNACSSCVEISRGTNVEVLEIDAASNRGIEDAKALKAISEQMPKPGKWRAVIIDECHQLTKEAQNALLALFESPPDSFLPILCTTDPEKVLDTIQSRVSNFQLRPIPQADIAGNLRRIFADYQQPVDDSVLTSLAMSTGGSLRDVQQIVDQLINAACGELITDEFFEVATGLASIRLYKRVAAAIQDAWVDGPAVWFEEVEALWREGTNLYMLYHTVIVNLIRDFRIAVVSRGLREPVVGYWSGIPHQLFEEKLTVTHADLDAMTQSWEEGSKHFGLASERADVEFWLLRAWDQARWEERHGK